MLDPIPDKTIDAGQTLSFTVTANDPDTWDTLTYTPTDLPSGATFVGQNFTWTPTNNQAGTRQVLFKVVDNGAPPLSDEKYVSITVNNVNRPPQFTDIGSQIVNEGDNLNFTVMGSDPDGDAVTFGAANLPFGATFDAETQIFDWTPGYDQANNYTVTFTISDGQFTVTQDVTITVGNKNRPPVLNPIGNPTTKEGELLKIVVTGYDDDGDALIYSADNLPSGAKFDPATHTFSWTPDYDQANTYNITFTVTDNGTTNGNPDPLTDSETITITVGNTNRQPTLNPIGPQEGFEGQPLQFSLNGSDPDGDSLTYSYDGSLPQGAKLTGNLFSWTPDFTQAGTYEVTFFATDDGDPNLPSLPQTVTITIGNVNRAPIVTSIGPKSGKEGVLIDFQVNATDPDGDGITYSCSTLPGGATFVDGKFSWTPNYGQAGPYTITFCATDDYTLDPKSGETTVVITVDQPSTSELINSIVVYVLSLKLDKNVENSYIANLKKVDGFILKGQITPAINQLNATIQKVDQDLKKGGLIGQDPAAQLKLMINELLSMLK